MRLKLFGEPLVAFAVIGGLLFALFSIAPTEEVGAIEVSQAFLDRLAEERQLVLGRPLTDTEKLAIRNDFIDQEILVREAMARRLYLNDGRVRHRLADKMFYLLAEPPGDPTPRDIDMFYEAYRERYQTPELLSFEHRFFSDEARARAAMDVLAEGGSIPDGQSFYLGDRLDGYSADEAAAVFGVPFSRALGDRRIGEWSGPLESGRGWHVVRVIERKPPADIPRAAIEDRILADWHAAQLAAARREELDELRGDYRVVNIDDARDD